MEKIIEGVQGLTDKRWIRLSFIPSVVFVLGLVIVFVDVFLRWNNIVTWWHGFAQEWQVIFIILVLATGLVISLVLDSAAATLFRAAAGIGWDHPYSRWLWIIGYRRYIWVIEKRQQFSETPRDARRLERIKANQLDYPQAAANIRPTEIGNIFSACVEGILLNYGLRVADTWSALTLRLDKDLSDSLTEMRSQIDFHLRMMALTWLFSSVLVAVGLRNNDWPSTFRAFLVGFVFVNILHENAKRAARQYADLIRLSYTIYRFELYELARLTPPNRSGTSEIERGALLSDYLSMSPDIASDDSLIYFNHGMTKKLNIPDEDTVGVDTLI